jgi:hypothetical protein
MGGFKEFMQAMHPQEASSFTGLPINPVEDIKTGLWQAACKTKQTVEKLSEIRKYQNKIPFTKVRMMPMPVIPDAYKIYLEEFNKKKIIT